MLSLQLKYFESAAKTENFSQTAQLYGVPTSTVSASIKKLEYTVGVTLFDRSANKIKLNEFGKILLKAVETSQNAFKKARSEIAEHSDAPLDEIHLLILANRKRVTDVIFNFKKKFPDVSFVIKHTLPDNTSELNTYDVIVAGDTIVSEQFEKEYWFREDVVLAVHKDNPLCKKKSVSAEDIQSQKLICMHKGSSIRNYMDAYFMHRGINANITIECDDPQYLAGYLEMNLGVVVLPVIAMEDFISPDIRLVKIEEGLHRYTCIYTNTNTSGIAKKFSQMLSKS